MASDTPLVFVSCGQCTEGERRLGRDICSLIKELCPAVTPYFAENQSTVEGLSNEILKALSRASGLVCIMHQRGDLTVPGGQRVVRGSVWVEQEIAIAAFVQHVLERSFPVLFYKQAGVSVEGMRSVLLMNPRREFASESEVLDDLRSVLPSTHFEPFSAYGLEPLLAYELIPDRSSGDYHAYKLTADIRNTGTTRVTDFELRIFFPRLFFERTSCAMEDTRRSNETHVCFVVTPQQGRAPNGLYPGDRPEAPAILEYFADRKLFHDKQAMDSEVRVELFSGSMQPKKKQFPIRDFQNF